MSDHKVVVNLEANASACLRVINQVIRTIEALGSKKVGDAGMPKLAQGAKKAVQGMREAKNETDALAASLGKLKNMVAGAFTLGAITNFGKKTLEASANMEVLRQGLDFVLGSSAETDKLINGMRDLGEQSAYDTNQLIPLARQWVNMGDDAETAVSKMTKIVDLGSAFGLTSDQIGSATLALTQMSSAGRINAQDMLQLTNAQIPAWKLLADAMGLSVAEVRELSQTGDLGEDAINTLWDAIEQRAKGATARMNGTLMACFSNLEEEAENSMATIGDIISNALNLKDILQSGSGMVQNFREMLGQIKESAQEEGLGQAIIDQVSNVSPELATLLGNIGNFVGQFVNVLVAGWQEAWNTLGQLDLGAQLTAINDVVSLLGPVFLAAATVIIGAINLILPVIVGLANAFAAGYHNIYLYIMDTVNMVQSIPAVVSGIAQSIAQTFNNIGQSISQLVDSLGQTASEMFNGALQALDQAFTGLIQFITQTVSVIIQTVSSIIQAVSQAFTDFVSWLESTVWTPIRNAAVVAINFIVGSWAIVGSMIMTALQPLADWFQTAVWQPICDFASAAWNTITALWNQFVSWFTGVMDAAANKVEEAWNTICETANEAWENITSVWNEFANWFSEVMNQVATVAAEVWDSICQNASEIWASICDVVNEAWNSICQMASAAWDTISGIWSVVSSWFDSTVIQPVRSSFDNGTNFIGQCFQNAYNTITSIFGGLASWFEDNVVAPIRSAFSKITSIGASITGMNVSVDGGKARPSATGGVFGGRIPALANGGQLKHGTPAIVGEAGPEAVLPLKKGVLGNIGNSIVDSSGLPQTAADLIRNAVDQAMAGAASMNANKKNPVYTAERSFSKASKPEDSDAYTKVLDKMKQKILDIDEAQEKFHQEWQKTAEEAAKYADGGEKTLRYQKQLQSNQEQIAKLQEKINSGKGDGSEAGKIDSLVQQGKNLTAKYEKEKAEALAAAQATQDGITQIDADAEAARMKAKQDALNQMGSYETQLAQAQYTQKKAMMATELDDFLAQMNAKDEITGQSYATTLANEQYLAEQRRVWMDELMLASVSWGEYMQTMLTNMAVQVQDGIASGIAQCVVEGKKFTQVMSNLAKTLLKQLIQGVIQKVISGWIMAIGLGNNRHKQEMKNTAAETEAAGAKATVLASAATAAVIAANPAGAAGAAALVSGQMGEAATAAGLIVKAAQAVFKGKDGGLSAGDTESGGQETVTKPTGPAIQIGDTSLLEKFPALANGGVVTGPTAALIGEGRYDEAVLPLKPSLLEKLFGSGESRQTTVVANQNIYGDINTREDDEDMFGGFNDLVLAGLRGA